MFLKKNIDVDVFDDVLQNTKHRANDAFNDVNRPPLYETPKVCEQQGWTCKHDFSPFLIHNQIMFL